jgi:hypothetical protein
VTQHSHTHFPPIPQTLPALYCTTPPPPPPPLHSTHTHNGLLLATSIDGLVCLDAAKPHLPQAQLVEQCTFASGEKKRVQSCVYRDGVGMCMCVCANLYGEEYNGFALQQVHLKPLFVSPFGVAVVRTFTARFLCIVARLCQEFLRRDQV